MSCEMHNCPFCGSPRLKFFSRIAGGYERYYIGQIHCMKCGARGPIVKSGRMDFREHLSEHGTAELARCAFNALSCETARKNVGFGSIQDESNAALIAAAPEMLKELERHCAICMMMHPDCEACELCGTRKVLKKARGEE